MGLNSGKNVPKFLKQDGDLDAIWRLGGVQVDVGFGCHGHGLRCDFFVLSIYASPVK